MGEFHWTIDLFMFDESFYFDNLIIEIPDKNSIYYMSKQNSWIVIGHRFERRKTIWVLTKIW